MAQLVKYLSLRHEDRHRGPQDLYVPCTMSSRYIRIWALFPKSISEHLLHNTLPLCIHFHQHSTFSWPVCVPETAGDAQGWCTSSNATSWKPCSCAQVHVPEPSCCSPLPRQRAYWPVSLRELLLKTQCQTRPGPSHLPNQDDKCNLSASLRPAWCRVQTDFSLRGGQGWTETPHSINTWRRMRVTLHFCGT